jgi:hypothetical protein
MTDEVKEESEPVWEKIEDLLIEVNSIHYAETKYRSKLVRIAWKELSEDDIRKKMLDMNELRKLSKSEQESKLEMWLNEDIVAKIHKAGDVKGCLNGNKITLEIWRSLPTKVRNEISADVLETREALMANFQ